jgi:hypothetical protein
MRRLLVIGLALAACGPSSSEIKQAKTARYTCEYDQIFQTAVEVIEQETPPLGATDEGRGIAASEFRWHSESGMRKEKGATRVNPGDVGFVVEVAIGKDDAGFHVRTLPRIFSQSPDSPQGREMSREDANWPGWADAKADAVQVQIHEKLSSCAAKGA